MKLIQSILILASVPFLFTSCLNDQCTREYTWVASVPVYKTYDEIRTGISMEASRDLIKPGKIYYYNDMLFINEQKEGVHIFDNSNPESPTNLGFLTIPGNVDISILDNKLYADNYTDLLTIDISNIAAPVILDREENVYPLYGESDEGILVDYELEERSETRDCDTDGLMIFDGREDDIAILADGNGGFDASGGGFESGGGSGIGGSLARFTIYNGHLYTIDNQTLRVFSLAQASDPLLVNEVNVGWEIETIFSYSDKLFIGSTTGMIIMDAANPQNPTYLSQYSHMYACDPVFVKEPYAYVTLREGNNWCTESGNQLDLVNITDMSNIFLEKSFLMDNPHGLSIRDNTLFVCEGDFGLKTFDIEEPLELGDHMLAHLRNIQSFDVISLPGGGNLLLVIGTDGFYQYNATDPTNLELLSHIPVIK